MYVIIDERFQKGDPDYENKEMNFEEVKNFFGEEYQECETIEEVNQKLEEQNAGDCGYKVIEVGEEKESESGEQKQNGWICRTWTETSLEGWTSEIERFDTEEEAEEHGMKHNRGLLQDELSREFEVYKSFTPYPTLKTKK